MGIPLLIHDGTGYAVGVPVIGQILAYGRELPTGPGYAAGCAFIKTSPDVGLYVNAGDATSANFIPLILTANGARWRYGDTESVTVPVDSATVIEAGDLLYLDVDDAKPASSQLDQGTEGTNQQLFHDNFLGVALEASASGETNSIRVATAGVFEFDILSTTLEIGDILAVDEAASGTQLEDQVVAKATSANAGVGRCVERLNPAGTKVHVRIVSSIVHGGTQAIL